MSTRAQQSPAWTTPGNANFAATRWSMVLAAADDPTGTRGHRALEELARLYWFPLYAFVRRQGCAPQQAEDLTQAFFARLLEKRYLASVDRAKGKFRSFLLASLKHFLCNEWAKTRAQKRGGKRTTLALDAEARYALEPADTMTPERLFERRWALAVLEQVLARLRQEYHERGSGPMFEALRGCLTVKADAPAYAEVAQALWMSESGVRVAAHRLRQRYRAVLRQEIAQTVASPDEVDEEINYLLRCL